LKKLIVAFALCLIPYALHAALPLVGFYKTIDDDTNQAKSIVRLYECNGDAMCGRIVALFDATGTKIEETISNPVRVAEILEGKPHLDGLDIIWEMRWDADSNEFSGGRIIDPKNGRVYRSRIWADPDDASLLRVRGMIGPFGRTQVWHAVATSDLPKDLQKLDTSKWEVVVR